MRSSSREAASRGDDGRARLVKALIAERLRGTAPPGDLEREARAAFAPDIAARLFPHPLVPAAVLVPIVERDAGLCVLLTRRTDHLRDHPGQISFPGGRIERADGGPGAAALRETREELGIDPARIEIIGYLPVHPVVTGFAVTPVVGFVSSPFELRPDPHEVAEAFEVPLAFLLTPGAAVAGTRRWHEIELPVWEFPYEGRRIWGATAQILRSLLNLIQ
jgi:8-oxo-dGTP pyrophosphatase MutT (NUDIX family)